MRGGSSDAAAIEVHNLCVLVAGEDNPSVEGIAGVGVDKAGLLQQLQGVTLGQEITPQSSSRGIAHLQFMEEGRVVHSALLQIPQCLGVMGELLVVESSRLLQHLALERGSLLLCEISDALAEGEVLGQFDKAN